MIDCSNKKTKWSVSNEKMYRRFDISGHLLGPQIHNYDLGMLIKSTRVNNLFLYAFQREVMSGCDASWTLVQFNIFR